jgi:PIN domain nuclease of toxin-antitoxin system
MKALLDTHTFLWWDTDNPRLSSHAKEIIADKRNEIYLSAASVWEMAIKTAKGKLDLSESPAIYISHRMIEYAFQALPILLNHAAHVHELPFHHNDPFDRMLIAQSQLEALPLLTADEEILRYDVEAIW